MDTDGRKRRGGEGEEGGDDNGGEDGEEEEEEKETEDDDDDDEDENEDEDEDGRVRGQSNQQGACTRPRLLTAAAQGVVAVVLVGENGWRRWLRRRWWRRWGR